MLYFGGMLGGVLAGMLLAQLGCWMASRPAVPLPALALGLREARRTTARYTTMRNSTGADQKRVAATDRHGYNCQSPGCSRSVSTPAAGRVRKQACSNYGGH